MKVKSLAFSFSFSRLVKAHSILDDMLGLEHARAIVNAILDRSKSNLSLTTTHASRQIVIHRRSNFVQLDIKSSQPLSVPYTAEVSEPQVINNTVYVSL